MSNSTHPDFSAVLIAWHRRHGRHDMPWQGTQDPYRVWLSEIMLQQTQVAAVIPYYQRFLEHFPSLAELANAPVEEVMGLWSGLGYYARARNLHRCAQVIMAEHAGRFPEKPDVISRLPGIGRSTANAIAVFCFGAREAILDGNVKRVLCRTHGIEGFSGTPAVEKRLWALAESLLPLTGSSTYIQAQMDLGATICTCSRPSCAKCPLGGVCVARNEGRIAQLPAARPRKALPQREIDVLLLHEGKRILLERRPPAGIWGGLLSLPELSVQGEPQPHAALTCGCAVEQFKPLAQLRHAFTHFQLTLRPWSGQAKVVPHVAGNSALCWVDFDEIAAAALPTPIRKIIDEFLRGHAPETTLQAP